MMLARKATPKITRILLVDDHPMVTRGIAEALAGEKGMDVVARAQSEAEAIDAAKEHKPDLAIVDLSLKNGTGLGLIKRLRTDHPTIRILVFTVHDEALYAERVMRAGANGYVNKGEPADKLLTAIRDVSSGGTAISDAMNDRLVQRALGQGNAPTGVESLSDRELEVFEHLGRGYSMRKIASTLNISIKTVETHRENIKKKLDISSASELTRFAVAWVENPA